MKRRVISFFLAIVILVGSLCARLLVLTTKSETAAKEVGSRTKEIAYRRGYIYDRSLTPLVNDGYENKLLITPTNESLSLLKKRNFENETLKILSDGYFVIANEPNEKFKESTESIKLVQTYKRYNNSSLLHIIGYTDNGGNGVCGIEKYFDEYLKKSSGVLVCSYSTDAAGRMLLNEPIEIRNKNYYSKEGVVLTIDKKIQLIAEQAMKKSEIITGAVIVTDIKTGEILACVSVPEYDRENLSKSVNSDNSPFMNRVLTAYPLGSVFKIVTSAAATENGIEPNKFYCSGKIEKSGTTFNCSKLQGHGYIDFDSALSKSCNPYFIDLGIKAGNRNLIETAKKLGFGKSCDLGNGFLSESGTIPSEKDLNSNAATGNFAFGQGKLTATPLQVVSLMTTIANSGFSRELKLIAGFTNADGSFTPNLESASKQILKPKTCEYLRKAMEKTTTDGTGKSAFSSLYTCCSKTSTAQSGQFNDDGSEIMYCWFAGFFPSNEPQYAVCIMCENGQSGGANCGPVFKEIAEQISILNLSKTHSTNKQ